MKLFLFLTAFISISYVKTASAQNLTPGASKCGKANMICSASELNSFCSSNSPIRNGSEFPCVPEFTCINTGELFVPENTSWWAFSTTGGQTELSVSYSNCTLGKGLEVGVWENCECGEGKYCIAKCDTVSGIIQLNYMLTPCKTYYLFIDGCDGDVCDFCLTTSGGSAPNLSPLSNIMGKDKVCEGFCGERWNVNDQPGGCDPYYEWTWDGVPVQGNESELMIDDTWGPGTYTLCVTAFIGNEMKTSICDEEGPTCKTITIVPSPTYKGSDKYICMEDLPYNWHGKMISSDSICRSEFKGLNCCKYDSVVQFHILPRADTGIYYHIACDNSSVYTDTIINKKYSSCQNNTLVILPGKSDETHCDSAYKLFAINPGYDVVFEFDTTNKNRLYTAHVLDTGHYCGNEKRMVRQYSYKWFTKQDSNKILGTDTFLLTKSKADYCFQLSVYITFGTIEDSCTFSFCENLDEDQLTNSFQQNLASKTILFPNPAENTLHISVPDYILIQYLEILKNDGSKLLQLQLKNKSNYTADISGLNNGAYYLVLHTNKGDIIKSFVKSEFK